MKLTKLATSDFQSLPMMTKTLFVKLLGGVIKRFKYNFQVRIFHLETA